jgi:predicted glycoside hydrolase/deacetylase ChbG (UPF0249 family)
LDGPLPHNDSITPVLKNFIMKKTTLVLLTFLLQTALTFSVQAQQTYAEKLGWPKGAKVVIFHVDDAGMSYNSNRGAIRSIEEGVATSVSIMMPCPWSAAFTKLAKEKGWDAGLHLTLTSEWKQYRWPGLTGKSQTPSLHDHEGALWPSVAEVVKNSNADAVEKEIRAQLDRALTIGFRPTHLDSHMGTLFADEAFLERYIKVGIEYGIPVMFPGGNNKLLTECMNYPVIQKLKAEGKWKEGMKLPTPAPIAKAKPVGEMIWKAGLPVLDDLHTMSGEWKPEGSSTLEEIGRYKTQKFKEIIKDMQPGVAMLIVHSTELTEDFDKISGSGRSRHADMLSMIDPELRKFIEKEGVILTTWKELMERRKKAK